MVARMPSLAGEMGRELGPRQRKRKNPGLPLLLLAILVVLFSFEIISSVLNTSQYNFNDPAANLVPTQIIMTLSTQDQTHMNTQDQADDSGSDVSQKIFVSEEAKQATSTQQQAQVAVQPKNNDDNEIDGASFCSHIKTALDITSWPDVIYHKDRKDSEYPSDYFDSGYVTSAEEDDAQARSTIHEFNKFRSLVLTPQLLKEGFQPGRIYPIRRFADRVRLLADSVNAVNKEDEHQRPIRILVFGSSFTIGSNCGESTAQASHDCAWPLRLARRFDEILFPNISDTTEKTPLVEWTMYQENAQGSANIAQKIPSIVEEFQRANTSPDAILLDNTIIDVAMNRPWFEAVVRAFIKYFPGTVLVSIVDGVSYYNENPEGGNHSQWLYNVQTHYGLTVVDMGKMSLLQRHDNTSTYIQISVIEEAKRIYREHPASGDNYDENTTIIDLIWPLADHMKSANGSVCYDRETSGEVYWSQFIPWTRKTKPANYPSNHPSWVTHQYVADAVMHAVLNLARIGSRCGGIGDDNYNFDETLESSVLETSVATMEEINSAFICEAPLTRIDAKSPPYVDHVIANLTSTNNDTDIPSKNYEDDVALVCGDWKWITDSRKRSGWQSDEYGSIIRFRLKVSADRLPTISITHMRSYETFGNVRVTLHPVSRKDLKENPSPVFGCGDIHKFLSDENGTVAVPSIEIDGSQSSFTSWNTAVFPHQGDWSDLNSRPYHDLLRNTVLSRMEESKDDESVEYVDVYVVNTNTFRMRIKIQTVTSC